MKREYFCLKMSLKKKQNVFASVEQLESKIIKMSKWLK